MTIQVEGKDACSLTEHAVTHGLNIANRDLYIQTLVTAARERPALRARAAVTRRRVAVLERAPADRSSR